MLGLLGKKVARFRQLVQICFQIGHKYSVGLAVCPSIFANDPALWSAPCNNEHADPFSSIRG